MKVSLTCLEAWCFSFSPPRCTDLISPQSSGKILHPIIFLFSSSLYFAYFTFFFSSSFFISLPSSPFSPVSSWVDSHSSPCWDSPSLNVFSQSSTISSPVMSFLVLFFLLPCYLFRWAQGGNLRSFSNCWEFWVGNSQWIWSHFP